MKALYLSLLFSFTVSQYLMAQIPYAELIEINQLDFISPFEMENSEFGEAVIRYYNPPGADPLFFNMIFLTDLDSWSDDWAIQNYPLPAFSDTMEVTTWIDLDPLDIYTDGDPISIIHTNTRLSSSVNLNPPIWCDILDIVIEIDSKTVALGHFPVPTGTHRPGPLTIPNAINWNPSSKETIIKTRGCNVPNIDLDSLNHGKTADYSGDWKACVQASTTNSFGWLRKNHEEVEDILKVPFPNNDAGARKMLEEFDNLMGGDGEGIHLGPMVTGKLDFIDKYEIPMRVKFQNVYSENPKDIASPNPLYGHVAEDQTDTTGTNEERISRDWIVNEFCEDEDVEMNFNCCQYFYDTNGQGGHVENLCWAHSVNLVSVAKVGGNYGLAWKDDLRQDIATGTRTFNAFLQPETIDNVVYLVIKELSDTIFSNIGTLVQRCFVREVVSESYDPTVSFEIIIDVIDISADWELALSPNPIQPGQEIKLEFGQQSITPITLNLYDLRGSLLMTREFSGSALEELTIQLPSQIAAGMYQLEVITPSWRKTRAIMVME